MLGLLLERLREAGAPSEDATERNGFLSYSAETHAIGHGLYDGMGSIRPTPKELPENEDVRAEPHYYKMSYVVGTLIQFCILAASVFGVV